MLHDYTGVHEIVDIELLNFLYDNAINAIIKVSA